MVSKPDHQEAEDTYYQSQLDRKLENLGKLIEKGEHLLTNNTPNTTQNQRDVICISRKIESNIISIENTMEKLYLSNPNFAQKTQTNVEDLIESSRDLKIELECLCMDYEVNKQTYPALVSYHNSTNIEPAMNQSTHFSNAPLPKLQLPKFHGNILTWPEFWEAFESNIHVNNQINNVSKFWYLKSLLEGEAKGCIDGLLVTDTNYTEAIHILKTRYENRAAVINNHYLQINKIKPATNNTISLKSTLNMLDKHIRSLESLGEEVHLQQFVTLILSKMPLEIANSIFLLHHDIEINLSNVRDEIHKIILAKETSELCCFTKENVPHPRNSSSLVMNNNYGNWKKSCIFCKNQHWSDECQKFPTLEERLNLIKNNCHICLRDNHSAKNCKRTKPYFYCKKVKTHHSSLCDQKFSTQNNSTTLLTKSQNARLHIVQVSVSNPQHPVITLKANALLDTGSERSFITEDLSKKLKLTNQERDNLQINTFGSPSHKQIQSKIVELLLDTEEGKMKLVANSTKHIINPVMHQPIPDNIKMKIQQMNIDNLNETGIKHIDILIGLDYFYEIFKSVKQKIQSGLYIVDTTIGQLIVGRIEAINSKMVQPATITLCTVNHTEENDILFEHKNETDDSIEKLWAIESMGNATHGDENMDLIQNFKRSVAKVDNRYVVSLPWKVHGKDLPSNYHLARGRLKSLIKRISCDKSLIKEYNKIFVAQMKHDVIEKITDEQPTKDKCHYIPHHFVTSNSSTTKLRIVFDASAKTTKENLSLNECLHEGPVMIEDLCGILMRFRLKKVAVTADIKKAYHQLVISLKDRDYTRFLWLNDINSPTLTNNLATFRFKRIPFGIISSPFLLQSTISYHLSQYSDQISDEINKSIYVDNLLHCFHDPSTAFNAYNTIKKMFSDASFNMREWNTNSKELHAQFDKNDSITVKILGAIWDTNNDTIKIKSPNLNNRKHVVSKRNVLEDISRIYDPLRLLSPITLKGKMFLKQLWRDWGSCLNEMEIKKWNKIASELNQIDQIRTSRTFPVIVPTADDTLKLVCFCDASQYAYACVMYLVICSKDKKDSLLIFAKCRLAPIKILTIPKLELMGAQLGSKMIKYVCEQLKTTISEKHILCDSKCVLHWIQNQSSPSTFARNRIKDITEDKEIIWSHVRSAENPADLATRGISTDDMNSVKFWFEGPDFITRNYSEWPVENFSIKEQQLKQFPTRITFALPSNDSRITNNCEMLNIGIDVKRFSDFHTLVRTVAWCIRFISHSMKRYALCAKLTHAKLNAAKLLLIKSLQETHLKKQIEAINNNTKDNICSNYGLFIDPNGFLRCGGRLKNINSSANTIHPLFLPKNSHLTNLIILQMHCLGGHCGKNATLTRFIHTYWTQHSRTTISKAISQCNHCNKIKQIPFKLPDFSPLPAFRTQQDAPFSYTGVDYAGPFIVYYDNQERKV